MCGRFHVKKDQNTVQNRFAAEFGGELEPSYNIAPTKKAGVVTGSGGEISVYGMPFRSKSVINARAETVHSKTYFSGLRRCLVPADGFFEWKANGTGKIPYRFFLENEALFAFAGLYGPNGFVILSRPTYGALTGIHDRAPVILEPAAEKLWLASSRIEDLISDVPMLSYSVSALVNSPRNNLPAVLERFEWPVQAGLF